MDIPNVCLLPQVNLLLEIEPFCFLHWVFMIRNMMPTFTFILLLFCENVLKFTDRSLVSDHLLIKWGHSSVTQVSLLLEI